MPAKKQSSVETFLRQHFNIDTSKPTLTVNLLTEAGEIPIRIDIQGGRAVRITTSMDNYLSCLYRDGFVLLVLHGVPLLRAGKYARQAGRPVHIPPASIV